MNQKFRNSINTVFYLTLETNKGIGLYKELTSTYNVKDKITPPYRHTQHSMGKGVYNHFSKIIRDNITKKEIIDSNTKTKSIQNTSTLTNERRQP